MLTVTVGKSVLSFLLHELGLARDAVEKIQTIFLNGKPVDDLEKTTVQDGAQLSLSAAMPGLVGATLRRGSGFRSFRGTITHEEKEAVASETEGAVTIKLFNLMMGELGPAFLERGIIVKSDLLAGMLTTLPDEFWRECRSVAVNDRHIDRDHLMDEVRSGGDVLALSAVTAD